MNWIDIEKQSPDENSIVLTYGHPNNEGVGITICSYSNGIFRFWESDKENKHNVTHWGELPNPPSQFKCDYCKDEGWIITDNGLTSSPCPMNCKDDTNKV